MNALSTHKIHTKIKCIFNASLICYCSFVVCLCSLSGESEQPESMLVCILQNVTRCSRTSWYFWHSASDIGWSTPQSQMCASVSFIAMAVKIMTELLEGLIIGTAS